MKRILLLSLFLLVILIACKTVYDLPNQRLEPNWLTKVILPYPQSQGGNADSGFVYLIGGEYTGSGLPYEYIKKRLKKTDKWVEKKWIVTPYSLSKYKSINGVEMMSGTCFSCHAGEVNGEVILGLGNSDNNSQYSLKQGVKFVNWRVKRKFRKDTLTLDAYHDFSEYLKAMAPNIKTKNPGANPAARIAESCMRYRKPEDLSYTSEAQYDIMDFNIGSDTPALWHMNKKNALYYTAVGRGDFTKLIFQASVLGVKDSTHARKMQQNFTDVMAWIRTLEPPKYPKQIDQEVAIKGKILFQKKCQSCHGTYDTPEKYPNKVVSFQVIKTDPYYALYANEGEIVEWYNKSWFANSEPKSWFEPELGYVAPPLDGIWATAPYFHNGSVPTIYGVLNSSARPKYWKKGKDSKDYDWQKVGWDVKEKKSGKTHKRFDTTIPGYGNQGHTFANELTDEQRYELIEYLKTL